MGDLELTFSLVPLVSAKALELFLGVIVDEASKVTPERGSKKVEAYHLCVAHVHFQFYVP